MLLLLLLPERGQRVNTGKCLSFWEGRALIEHHGWPGCGLRAQRPGQQELITRALSQQGHLPPLSFQANMEFPRPKPFDACLRASGLSAFQKELSAEE